MPSVRVISAIILSASLLGYRIGRGSVLTSPPAGRSEQHQNAEAMIASLEAPSACQLFFDRLCRIADLFDGVPQFGGGDPEFLGPVPNLIGFAEIDPIVVSFVFQRAIVRHGGTPSTLPTERTTPRVQETKD
jgi:hypothetical protein